jgi:hypothetical protein
LEYKWLTNKIELKPNAKQMPRQRRTQQRLHVKHVWTNLRLSVKRRLQQMLRLVLHLTHYLTQPIVLKPHLLMIRMFTITVGLVEELLVNGDYIRLRLIRQLQHLLKHVQLAAQR